MLIFYDHYGESFWIIESYCMIIIKRPFSHHFPPSFTHPGLQHPGSLRLAAGDRSTAGLADATLAALGLGPTGPPERSGVNGAEKRWFHGRFHRILVGCDMMWPKSTRFVVSMDWLKGKITGKPHISWENRWFPVDFPLNQSIDCGFWLDVTQKMCVFFESCPSLESFEGLGSRSVSSDAPGLNSSTHLYPAMSWGLKDDFPLNIWRFP